MKSLVQFCMSHNAVMYTDMDRDTGNYIIQVKIPLFNISVRRNIPYVEVKYAHIIEEKMIEELERHINMKKAVM
jgi:hypothetical protein